MAEATVDEKALITCGCCKKHYANPKTLPCLHSFCLGCLRGLAAKREGGKLELTCPDCRKVIIHGTSDLSDLPEAFQINRQMESHKFMQKVTGALTVNCEKCSSRKAKATGFCVSCEKFICEICTQVHLSWPELRSHKTVKLAELKEDYTKYTPVPSAKEMCPMHSKQCLIYCESCEFLICHECILKGHRDHKYEHADESIKKHKKDMIESLDTINHLPVQLHSAIQVIDAISDKFSSQGKSVEQQLDEVFEKIQSVLANRRDTLRHQHKERIEDKVSMLLQQKQLFERIMHKLSTCITFVSQTTDANHVTEFFLLEKQMQQRISELSNEFSKLDLTPVEEPEVHFTFKRELLTQMESTGAISDGSILYCSSEKTKSGSFHVGEVVSFYIALSSAFYKTCNNPMEEIQAEIQSLRDGSFCPATVAVSSCGFAKMQCSFSDRGRYAVHVKVGKRHISGSPYCFFVQPNGAQLQQPVKTISKLQGPKGLTVNNKNQIIVCEENCHTVTVYGKKAKKLLSIGEFGKDKGQFNHPTGVTVDNYGCIYIADSKNDRVQKFDTGEGGFLGEYYGDKAKNTHLNSPSSVKIGPDGNLYVVDRGNNRIIILTQALEYVNSFGSAGYGLGQLHDPWDVAFDQYGFIYVTDTKQHCVQIFTTTGSFRGKIGSPGQQKGKLNRPAGITIDRFGKMYVCESGNHRVSIFHISSEFIECFSIGLSMVNPCGIAVDNDGFLYVASAETVHVF